MKLDFWRFPSISCQARHWWVMLSRFAFSLGCVSFVVWATAQKNWEKLFYVKPPHSWLLHKWSCNFDIKKTDLYYVPSVSIGDSCLHNGGCSPLCTLLWRAFVVSLPCPKATAGAEGRLCAAQPRGHFHPLSPTLFFFLSVIHWQEEGQTEMGFYVA